MAVMGCESRMEGHVSWKTFNDKLNRIFSENYFTLIKKINKV